ncbi:hypothetical protein [Streptomyces celluloflavus]|uniref:hypothetical protein n=1 Tax=Streptomyces celluloflavus TaxID=58344 RepID=UPI0034613296|nr:hypothetical protein OG717_30715 [Streptomyces celluloflavus]
MRYEKYAAMAIPVTRYSPHPCGLLPVYLVGGLYEMLGGGGEVLFLIFTGTVAFIAGLALLVNFKGVSDRLFEFISQTFWTGSGGPGVLRVVGGGGVLVGVFHIAGGVSAVL